MSTKLKVGGVLIGAVVAASVAQADGRDHGRPDLRDHNRGYGNGTDYARVVDVDPIVRHVRTSVPRQECYEETRYRGREDDGVILSRNGTAGHTILGAVIGAGIGNSIGSGDGRRAATVAGAIIGSAIGHDVGERRRDQWRSGRSEEPYRAERCETRYEERYEDRTEGYRVTYEYNGQRYTTRLPYDPGEKIRVRVSVTPDE
jgi:uncharacterized protein YcfJ